MKKLQLLLLTLLIPFLGYTQNSWINIQLLTDDYPEETSWTITPPGGSPIIAQNDSGMVDLTLYDTIIPLGGTIIVSIFDQYGDGLGGYNGSPEGWFLVQNDCQDTIMYVAGDFGSLYTDTLIIAPCAPPAPDVLGCIDTNALNFDSLATVDDGTCTYPPCNGFLTSTASQNCLPNGQTLAQFFWTLDNNINCEPVKFWYSNEDGVGPFQYGIGPGTLDFAVYAGNGQMPPNWSVEHYGWVEFIDGTLSDTIFYTPTPCIPGCTDPTQTSYNPWATFNDGSCAGTTCDTATQYQISISITLDNWPGETSWQFVDGLGNTFDYPTGTYDFNDIGQTYTYSFCVDQNAAFEMIINDQYGDGMAGSTSGGSIDGAVVIYDCSGDTIWYMDNPGFGNVLYSGPQTATPCPTTPTIDGCTDDDYVEFNPAANNDDGSCLTLHTYGCTDITAFNYDPLATMMDLIPDCNYLLEIFDAGGDGWGNSFIGIYQNGIDLGTYTMGPGNYGNSWNIILDPGIPVEVRYFEVGGPQQPPQEVQFQTWHNSFKLTNADGFVLMYEGTNPFANNGQGALQSFESPFWTKYVNIPFCGNTCIPVVLGCMDSTAANYNALANVDDGNCIPIIYGCTNEFALNYDSLATVDDNTCIAIVNGCMDTAGYNYNALANVDDGSCIYLGCTDVTACNYDAIANVDNGGCTYPVQYYDCYSVCLNDVDADGVCDELEIAGCTNPLSINFNPTATDDDGTCVGIINGCTDSTMFNYNILANTDDGSCIPYIYGCTDPQAFNYDVTANTDDNTCIPVVIGCMDATQFNFDPTANTPSGNCIPYAFGCMDPTMFNYDPLANTDNGNCIPFIYGCTDATALNYDPLANTNDNSCIPFIYGCTDSTQFNYNPLANTDNGSCIPFIYGCTDAAAFNYNPAANTNDNSCCLISGCTDSTALNYNQFACFDDNSCITIITGCTDVSAFNYDPTANVTDSLACLYDAGCYGGPGVPYWLNDVCYAWVIDVDNNCCTDDWDSYCVNLYDYCQQGMPTNIEELLRENDFVIYPNPTKDIVNLAYKINAKIDLYGPLGNLMVSGENIKQIDLNAYSNGIYVLYVTYNNKTITHKIIKQ